MKRMMRKRGYTDTVYWMNVKAVWSYTLLCVILSVLGRHIGIDDYSFVSVVCPLCWAELGVHTAYIVKKAWLENLNKYGLVDKDNVGGIQ